MIETIYRKTNSYFHQEIVLIPPGIRTIKFSVGDGSIVTKQLALPYCVLGYGLSFCGTIKRIFLGWVNDPNCEQVYFPLMPSVSASTSHIPIMCFSKANYRKIKPEDIKFEMTRLLFQSEFHMYGSINNSTWTCQTLLRDTFLKSWDNWERLTREHNSPDFMLDFDRLYENINQKFYVSTLSQWKEELKLTETFAEKMTGRLTKEKDK
jgi:hypothetical protein